MKIRLVGTGSIGAFQSSASSLIDGKILIDMPNGIVKKLKQTDVDVFGIKTILITHLHGDHFFDIPFYMFEKFFNNNTEETNIYCPKGTLNKVKQLFEIGFPGDYEKLINIVNINFIEFNQLKNENILDDFYVNSVLVNHGNLKPAYGYILNKDEKTIGFSGDSGMCESINYIIEKSEISVLDMSLINGNSSHLGIDDIEKLCKKYENKKIIATHIQDNTRELAKTKQIKNLIIPEDGQEIILN